MNRAAIALFGLLSFASVTLIGADSPAGADGQPAAGGGAAGGRVAVLDLVKIYNECAQIRDLNEMMKQQSEDFAKEAAQRRQVIEDKQTALTAFRPGSADHDRYRKELVRLNIEANVWLKVTEQQMEQEKFDWTRIIYEQAVKVSGDVAREQGYDIVLQRNEFKPDEIDLDVAALRRLLQSRTVVYHEPDIDITDVVIRRMDADYETGGGKKKIGPLAPVESTPP
jgi:Skp family chaperone for outer membrane proteins